MMDYKQISTMVHDIHTQWYVEYPIRVMRERIDEATDKLMAQDPEWTASEELCREDMRVAFQEWLDQRILDILDDPIGETGRAWSGFDDTLSRIQKKHRAQVHRDATVVDTRARYYDLNSSYSALMTNGALTQEQDDQAWEKVKEARQQYLDAVENALTGHKE